jgi:uncharacterized protein YutD
MKLKDMTLSQLQELRGAVNDVCERYAVVLTDYRTISGDFDFNSARPKEIAMYRKRMEYIGFLEKIDERIEGLIEQAIKDERDTPEN